MLRIRCIFLIFGFTATPVLSISGKHFVIACPWIKRGRGCFSILSTQKEKVSVTMNEVGDDNVVKEARLSPLIVDMKKALKVQLSDGEKKNAPIPQIAFKVYVFKADEIFRMLVFSWHNLGFEADTITLTPKESCFKSYYTMSAVGEPFIAVFAFDYPQTNVKVEFTNSGSYSVSCFADVKCEPGKNVTFVLSQYRAWFFYAPKNTDIVRAAHLTSDLPIHVISGSAFGHARTARTNDIATTALLPLMSWGKRYIVPLFIHNHAIYTFTSKKTPLEITFSELVGNNVSTKVHRHVAPQDSHFDYGMAYSGLCVTAEYPFALFKVFSSRESTSDDFEGDACILSIIPVEMWKSSFLYVKTENHPKLKAIFVIVIEGTSADVDISPEIRRSETSVLAIKGATYTVETIGPPDKSVRISGKKLGTNVILYIIYKPKRSYIASIGASPYEYNIAEIYSKDCVVSIEVEISDAKDNDCDGQIDEELKNLVDDDNDGLIDEDNGELYSDGEWGQWYHACHHLCTGRNKLSVSVRSCENRSRAGKDCEGISVQCDEGICPDNCDNPACFCKAGCETCDKSVFLCDTRGCKSGYQTTPYCLEPCPKGLTGIGCNETIKNVDDVEAGSGFWLVIIMIVAAAVTAAAICCLFAKRRNTEEDKGETGKENAVGPEPAETDRDVAEIEHGTEVECSVGTGSVAVESSVDGSKKFSYFSNVDP